MIDKQAVARLWDDWSAGDTRAGEVALRCLRQIADGTLPVELVATAKQPDEITVTVAQIKDLVEFAGLTLHPAHMPDEDDLETEFTIRDFPAEGVKDDEGVARHYGLIAYCTDYPEEGCMPLGPELERPNAELRGRPLADGPA